MWPPMWTRIAARGLWRSAFASKSSKDMQRSSRLQSTNSTSAPAPIAASGVAMKVLEGQRTVSPRTPANSSAASAPPAQLDMPTLSSPFHSRPAPLECLQLGALGPLLGVEHLGPEIEEPAAIAVVEPDRELRSRRTGLSRGTLRVAPGSSGWGPGGDLTGYCRRGAARLAANPDVRKDSPHRPDQLRASWADSSTAPTAREPASRTVPATATAMKATSATPPERRRRPGLAEDQRRQHDRDQDLDREHHRGDPGRRALCRALISLSSASPSEAAAVASQAAATSTAPGGQLVGEQLAGDRGPGVAAAGADHGQRPARPGGAGRRAGRSGSRRAPAPIAIAAVPAWSVLRSGAAQATPATPSTIAADRESPPALRAPPPASSPRARAAGSGRSPGRAGRRSAAPAAAPRSPAASRGSRAPSPPASAGCAAAGRSARASARAPPAPPAPPAPAARSRCCRGARLRPPRLSRARARRERTRGRVRHPYPGRTACGRRVSGSRGTATGLTARRYDAREASQPGARSYGHSVPDATAAAMPT